jgi:hypothetical protein
MMVVKILEVHGVTANDITEFASRKRSATMAVPAPWLAGVRPDLTAQVRGVAVAKSIGSAQDMRADDRG